MEQKINPPRHHLYNKHSCSEAAENVRGKEQGFSLILGPT